MNENTATTVGQIHAEGTSLEEQKPQEPVTVSMKKLIAGVGTVFAGVIEMLEALEPHVAQHLVDVAVQHTADEKNTVSEDDLTKIIVRKIKQNRSNNEKIGAILRTYGVSKVSELPVSKYEAFLTDVSQL